MLVNEINLFNEDGIKVWLIYVFTYKPQNPV